MKHKSTSMFITLIAISLVIFLFDRSGALFAARGVLEAVFTRPGGGVHSMFVPKTQEDSDTLLLQQQQELEKVKKENEELRAQLGIGKSGSQKLILASVLSTSRGFIIDKGFDDGIRAHQTVVFKNILVGKIATVGKKTSRVLLPFENGSAMKVRTSQSKALGLVKGQGQEALLSEVLLSENLKEDDVLITAGEVDEEGLGVRPDLLVGKITNIRKSDNQLFQEAQVIPLIAYKALSTVFVVQ